VITFSKHLPNLSPTHDIVRFCTLCCWLSI